MKHRLAETGKNILIVLLSCSLILLTLAVLPSQWIHSTPGLSQLLQPVAPLLGLPEAELTYVAEAAPMPDAARPIAISIKNSTGRHSAMWDFTKLDLTFEPFASILGHALDQTEQFNQVSEEQVLQALTAPGVLFRYSHALPAALPASWLGGSLEAAVGEIHTYILSASGDIVTLYLLGQTRYAAATALPSAELLALVEQYEADGSQLAFESEFPLSSLSLLPGSAPSVPAFTLSNPCDSRYIETLATVLGFNPYGESRYTDDQGAVHFSETNASLEITAGGLVTFRAEVGRYEADSQLPQDLADTARQLMDRILSNAPGDGRLYLTEMTKNGTAAECKFEYVLSGIPVTMTGAAGHVVFDGQSVTEASVQVLSFTATGKTISPLPVAQAAAVLPQGSTLEMAYCINADDTLSAGWRQE